MHMQTHMLHTHQANKISESSKSISRTTSTYQYHDNIVDKEAPSTLKIRKMTFRSALSVMLGMLMAVCNVSGAPMKTCGAQNSCFSFTIEAVSGAVCSSPECAYKVCWTWDKSEGCAKSSSDTISHSCVKNAEECQSGVDLSLDAIMASFDDAAEIKNYEFGQIQCQTGVPGQTLYFLMKDGDGCSGSTFESTLENGLELSCAPSTATTCTGEGNIGKECVWSVTLPSQAPEECDGGDGGGGGDGTGDSTWEGALPEFTPPPQANWLQVWDSTTEATDACEAACKIPEGYGCTTFTGELCGVVTDTGACENAGLLCHESGAGDGSWCIWEYQVLTAGTVCAEAGPGLCDEDDTCDGSSMTCAEKFDNSKECRPAAGLCDVAETCDGTSADCPADVLVSPGTSCRVAEGDCDIEEFCDGSTAACPEDLLVNAGTPCRSAAGDCDIAEKCTGNSGVCPPDAFIPAATKECRGTAGDCDVAEWCNGTSVDCPPDVFIPAATKECRGAAGDCDKAEWCNGASVDCPADEKEAATVECRPERDFAGSCDVAEFCDGSSNDCPPDGGIEQVGMAFKCANTIYFANGFEEKDLKEVVTGKKKLTYNYYFPGEGDGCNIAYNQNSEYAFGELIDGCAPMTCDNNRGLSHLNWGTCEWNDPSKEWLWQCGGKVTPTSGDSSAAVCPPPDALATASLGLGANGEAKASESGAKAAGAGSAAFASLSVGSSVVSLTALLVVGVLALRVARVQRELADLRSTLPPGPGFPVASMIYKIDQEVPSVNVEVAPVRPPSPARVSSHDQAVMRIKSTASGSIPSRLLSHHDPSRYQKIDETSE